jgi:hypothetical protein
MFYEINSFDEKNKYSSPIKCPIMSAAGEGYLSCITNHCAMWIRHKYKGKYNDEGHCGLVRLPFTNVTITEDVSE